VKRAGLTAGRPKPGSTVVEVERTLVKSPPELWQVLDGAERTGITAREPERRLAWRDERDGSVEVTLEKKGWGTHVTVRSEHGDAAAIERLLDDLGTAHRRPFSRI
jgi:hypothetical protein